MPGLLSQTAAVRPGGAASRAAPQGQDRQPAGAAPDTGEQPNVSPQEQAQYDQFVDAALQVVYDEKTLPRVIESLKGDNNPLDGLANTAVVVVTRVEDSAEKAGVQLSPDVVLHGGAEILEDLADLAEQAGVHKFTPEEIEGAVYKAMDLYRERKGLDGGPHREQVKQDFEEVVALDQAGELDELAPGLSKKFPPPGRGAA